MPDDVTISNMTLADVPFATRSTEIEHQLLTGIGVHDVFQVLVLSLLPRLALSCRWRWRGNRRRFRLDRY